MFTSHGPKVLIGRILNNVRVRKLGVDEQNNFAQYLRRLPASTLSEHRVRAHLRNWQAWQLHRKRRKRDKKRQKK